MHLTVRLMCVVGCMWIFVSPCSAQRNTKPLDRGIHKRKLLNGFSILRDKSHSKHNDPSFLDVAPKTRFPIKTMASRTCLPISINIHGQHNLRPSILTKSRSRTRDILKPLRRRQAHQIHFPQRFQCDSLAIEKDTLGNPMSDKKPAWGTAVTLAGLAVSFRALALGQEPGDWFPGGTGRPTRGLVLGGGITIIGAIISWLEIRNHIKELPPDIVEEPEEEFTPSFWNPYANWKYIINTARQNRPGMSTVPAWKKILTWTGFVLGVSFMGDLLLLGLFSLFFL